MTQDNGLDGNTTVHLVLVDGEVRTGFLTAEAAFRYAADSNDEMARRTGTKRDIFTVKRLEIKANY